MLREMILSGDAGEESSRERNGILAPLFPAYWYNNDAVGYY
jgi:hypothetical protein